MLLRNLRSLLLTAACLASSPALAEDATNRGEDSITIREAVTQVGYINPYYKYASTYLDCGKFTADGDPICGVLKAVVFPTRGQGYLEHLTDEIAAPGTALRIVFDFALANDPAPQVDSLGRRYPSQVSLVCFPELNSCNASYRSVDDYYKFTTNDNDAASESKLRALAAESGALGESFNLFFGNETTCGVSYCGNSRYFTWDSSYAFKDNRNLDILYKIAAVVDELNLKHRSSLSQDPRFFDITCSDSSCTIEQYTNVDQRYLRQSRAR